MSLLKISKIKTESGTQTRVMINEDTVADYAEAMESGVEFPPIVVYHDGTDYYMADGFHRCLGASRIGLKEISAEIRKGTRIDALKYALGANCTNGLRRTNDDKHRCVEIALREFPDWSDRKIEEACGVSDYLVATVRKETGARNGTSTLPADQPQTRTGRDGKQYPTIRKISVDEISEAEQNRNLCDSELLDKPFRRTTKSSIGMMHAENAIRQLEKIPLDDLEIIPALNHVSKWIQTFMERVQK